MCVQILAMPASGAHWASCVAEWWKLGLHLRKVCAATDGGKRSAASGGRL